MVEGRDADALKQILAFIDPYELRALTCCDLCGNGHKKDIRVLELLAYVPRTPNNVNGEVLSLGSALHAAEKELKEERRNGFDLGENHVCRFVRVVGLLRAEYGVASRNARAEERDRHAYADRCRGYGYRRRSRIPGYSADYADTDYGHNSD